MQEIPARDATRLEVQVYLAELESGYATVHSYQNRPPSGRLPVAGVMPILSKLNGTAKGLFDVVFYNDTKYFPARDTSLARCRSCLRWRGPIRAPLARKMHICPDALFKKAEKGLETASFKDVEWLDLDALPPVSCRIDAIGLNGFLKW